VLVEKLNGFRPGDQEAADAAFLHEYNAWVPCDCWLEDCEKQAVIGFHLQNPVEGYRRLTYMIARRRHRAGESDQRMARVGAGGTVVEVEPQSRRRRARAFSGWQFINTGTSTCRISTTAGRSTTCAAFCMVQSYILNWDLRES